VTEFQVTTWRDLPSLVVARDGDHDVKALLAPRFQEAIDEAAMRLGDTASDDYLAGWARTPWTAAEGGPADVCDRLVRELEDQWPAQRLAEYLDQLGSPS
jgi:Virulence factor